MTFSEELLQRFHAISCNKDHPSACLFYEKTKEGEIVHESWQELFNKLLVECKIEELEEVHAAFVISAGFSSSVLQLAWNLSRFKEASS